MTVIFLTSGSSWTVPVDWSSTNTIECLGSGGIGTSNGTYGGGGGGGAYAKISGFSATPGSSIPYQVGTGGGSLPTYFNSTSTVLADYGRSSIGSVTGGSGGLAANSVGTVVYSGGNGGSTSGGAVAGAGGGGSAGPSGAGKNGGNVTNSSYSGAGGGGANGGSSTAGGNGTATTSGAGGAGTGGTGGGTGVTSGAGNNGTLGGGGSGGQYNYTGGNGGADTTWTTKGCGGGGGGTGGNANLVSGAGANYGGGGGGEGVNDSGLQSVGGNGLIVITYTPNPNIIYGTVASTESKDTTSAAGTAARAGYFASTEKVDTVAATGGVSAAGGFSSTETNDVAVATAGVPSGLVVQPFSITIPAGKTSASAYIGTVGLDAFIVWSGENPSVANDPAEDFAYLTLANPSTVTATRNTGTAGTVVISGYVIDAPSSLIASVQYGTVVIAGSASSGTATINSVNNSNAAIHLLGWATTNTTLSGINEYPVLSLSGTTVTAQRVGTTGTLTVGYVVVEFQTAALNQAVQNVSATSSTSATSYTATINSVNMNNAFTFYAGSSIATETVNLATIKQLGFIFAATTLTVAVNTAAAYAKTYNCSVVEFVPGILQSPVQRGTTLLAAVTSASTVLSSINENNSFSTYLGNMTTATTAVLNRAEGLSYLSSQSTGSPVIQNQGDYTSGGTALAVGITATSGGNTIVVAVTSTIGDAISLTDNLSQTYTQIAGSTSTDTTGNVTTSFWYCQNTSAGVTLITISATLQIYAVAFELSGVPTTGNIVDVVAVLSNQNQVLSGNISGPAITTTSANDIILSMSGNYNSASGVYSPYTTDIGTETTGYYAPGAVVSGNSCTFSFTIGTYCISTVAIFGSAGGVVPAIVTTKNNATANITSSWEVVEFAPFIPPYVPINLSSFPDVVYANIIAVAY